MFLRVTTRIINLANPTETLPPHTVTVESVSVKIVTFARCR